MIPCRRTRNVQGQREWTVAHSACAASEYDDHTTAPKTCPPPSASAQLVSGRERNRTLRSVTVRSWRRQKDSSPLCSQLLNAMPYCPHIAQPSTCAPRLPPPSYKRTCIGAMGEETRRQSLFLQGTMPTHRRSLPDPCSYATLHTHRDQCFSTMCRDLLHTSEAISNNHTTNSRPPEGSRSHTFFPVVHGSDRHLRNASSAAMNAHDPLRQPVAISHLQLSKEFRRDSLPPLWLEKKLVSRETACFIET